MMFVSVGTAVPQWHERKVKFIAVGAAKRMELLPEMPTVAESGVPGYEAVSWFGLFGPPGMPADVVAKINAEVRRMFADPELRKTLDREYFTPIVGSPEELTARIRADEPKWRKVIQARRPAAAVIFRGRGRYGRNMTTEGQMRLGAFFNPRGTTWPRGGTHARRPMPASTFSTMSRSHAPPSARNSTWCFSPTMSACAKRTWRRLSRSAQYIANFEPLTLLSALAPMTSHIGLVATASTSYNEPFHVARKFASIDHISGGRAGWNLVTSGQEAEAKNFGREKHYAHGERYERAREFAQVVTGLWDSWDDDAFVRDKASGQFFHPDKLHPLNHKGENFSVRGPLNVPRTPQGRPVIVQAGGSEDMIAVAAEFAEVIFCAPLSFDHARKFYAELKGQGGEPRPRPGPGQDHARACPASSAVPRRRRRSATSICNR